MTEEINDLGKVASFIFPTSPHVNDSNKAISPQSPRQTIRIKLNEQQLDGLNKNELAVKWREQDVYIDKLESQNAVLEGELTLFKESKDKYRQQYTEVSQREKILVRKLASKEQEIQDHTNQINEMKASQAPSVAALRSTLLDPAVNILIQKLRQELITTKAKLEDTQNELSAWKFTPDSNTGKRLMAKCRLLYQENEELGRMISSGRIAKLEGELALQKSYSEEVKKSQSELDEFLQDLDEDVEGMQSTIYFLQQELRKARESLTLLQQENTTLKSITGDNSLTNGLSPHTPPIKRDELEDNAVDVKQVKSEESDQCKEDRRTPPLPSDNTSISEIIGMENMKRTDNKFHQSELNDENSSDLTASIKKKDNKLLNESVEEDDLRACKRTLRTKNNNKSSEKINGEEVLTRTTRGRDRSKRDKSMPGSDDEKIIKKKQRKEGLLCLEFNDKEESLSQNNGSQILPNDSE